jgi:hypothetical protein
VTRIPGAATGGWRSGLTWVGEEGPELVNLPGGSYVNTAAQSRGAATTVVNATVNVTGPTLDPMGDFAQRLSAALVPSLQRELARQGISL